MVLPWPGEGSIAELVEVFQAVAGQLELQPNRQNNRTAEAAEVEDLAGEVDWEMQVVEERMG